MGTVDFALPEHAREGVAKETDMTSIEPPPRHPQYKQHRTTHTLHERQRPIDLSPILGLSVHDEPQRRDP